MGIKDHGQTSSHKASFEIELRPLGPLDFNMVSELDYPLTRVWGGLLDIIIPHWK